MITRYPWTVIGIGAFVFAGILLQGLSISSILFVLLGGLLGSFALLSILGVLSLLLFIRPSLDIFSEYTVSISAALPSLNVAGGIALALIGLGMVFLIHHRTELQFPIPLQSSIGALLVVIWGGVLFGDSLGNAIAEAIRLSTFFLVYLIVFVAVRSEKQFFQFLGVIFFSSIIPALVGSFEYVTGRGIYTNPGFDNRIMATFGHPNVFAYYLVIILAVSCILWFRYKTRFTTWASRLFRIYVVILWGLLLATYTRGAWIAAFIIFAVVAWRYYRKHAFALIGIGTLVGIMLLTFSSILNVYTATEMPSFEKIPVYDRITDLFEGKVSDSILWRMHMWRDMWNYGWQAPWIGDGTGHVKQAVETVRGVELGALEIHNDYIRVFVEWGLVGLAVFFIFIGSIFWALGRRIYSTPHYILIIGLSLAVGVYIATGWDNLLRQTANMWLFFGILAAIFKWYQLEETSSEERESSKEIQS